MLKAKKVIVPEPVVQLSQEEQECLETLKRCWPYLPERTKGYMLGAAETNVEMILMRKKVEATNELTVSALK